MIKLADIIIVMPGGFGTLDELVEVLALSYLKIINKKIIILNFNNYWNPLRNLILKMKKNDFIDDENFTNFILKFRQGYQIY